MTWTGAKGKRGVIGDRSGLSIPLEEREIFQCKKAGNDPGLSHMALFRLAYFIV